MPRPVQGAKIGRASCRERVEVSVVAVSLKEKSSGGKTRVSDVAVLEFLLISFFFFQAEDGIRDHCVTGVQTCALPICSVSRERPGCHTPAARVKRSSPSAVPTRT